ncbi:hypothetical protein DFH28DRAFT_933540 [Melampsora americana]|nr:hypothetical protein DFH28DRAFT_933540 [Melampsora americana]
MSIRSPLTQIPSGTDLPGLMSRVSHGFQNPIEGKSVLNLGRGTIIKVHLYKNIAYYYARSNEGDMCCYIFALDMGHPLSRAGKFYGLSSMSGIGVWSRYSVKGNRDFVREYYTWKNSIKL